MQVVEREFLAFEDQNPGTSGLRKPTTRYQTEHYTESFIQAIFNVLGIEGKTIVLGGDGRFYNDKAVEIILKMAAAQRCAKVILGANGILSTPAASHLIRYYQADYGIILSACHNPGGKNGDFGIKFNLDAGQPAPESVTAAVFAESKNLKSYKIATMELPKLQIGSYNYGLTVLEVISPTADYANLLEHLFDFEAIRNFLAKKPIIYDAMHAVTGPYAREIFH